MTGNRPMNPIDFFWEKGTKWCTKNDGIIKSINKRLVLDDLDIYNLQSLPFKNE